MSYITNSDIETRVGSAAYVQLADDDGNGIADAAVVDEIRLAAEGEVNSYLARRFAVPIDIVSLPELAALLKSVALDLAEFRLRARRPPVSAEAATRRDLALVWLKAVAAAVVDLPSSTALPASPVRGSVVQVGGESPVLSHEELSGH